MTHSIPAAVLLDMLAERGLLPPWESLQPLAGNADRNPERPRRHWLVRLRNGTRIKISQGENLDDVQRSAIAWWHAMPDLAPPPPQLLRWESSWITIEPAIDSSTIEELFSSFRTLPLALKALERALAGLNCAEKRSTEGAWDAEWQKWSEQVLTLPCWSPGEVRSLRRECLPALRAALHTDQLTRRWSNGDCTSENLRVTPTGQPILTDVEHAAETHFFAEDLVRFEELSEAVRQHPALLDSWWPRPAPAWLVFFHLRQLTLDHAINSAEYLNRTVAPRKTALARAARDSGLPIDLAVSDRNTPGGAFAAETVQLFWPKGPTWTEAASRRVTIRRAATQFAVFRLSEETRRLRLDPAATARRVQLTGLNALPNEGDAIDVLPVVQAENATLERHAGGSTIIPANSDPQLHFELPAPAKWLLVELAVAE